MKKIISACTILFATFVICASIAFADDCAVGRTPEGVYPMKNEDIIMTDEDIRIYPYEGRAECSFEFLNTGEEKDILMGFPCKQIPDPDALNLGNTVISDFTAWDGKAKLNVVEDKSVKPPKSFDLRFDKYSSWFTFTVHLKKDERKTITNSYKFTMSVYSTGTLRTGYIINTGSVWKDNIWHAKVSFFMPGLKPYYLESISGEPYFRFEEDKIIWERTAFEPEENMDILFNRYDELIKNSDDSTYRDNYIKTEKELTDLQNSINKLGKDELIKLIGSDYGLNAGLRLTAYEKLAKLDPLYDYRINMKIGYHMATTNGIIENLGLTTTPQIIENRTFVPLRFIIEKLGGTVGWNGKTKEITIEYNYKKIMMKIGQRNYLADNKPKTMDAAPKIVNGTTLVPLRYVAESMGNDVGWFDKDKSILISHKRGIEDLGSMLMKDESVGNLALGTEDKECVKLIGEAEKKSEPTVWGADGLEHQSWNYASKGIELDMTRVDGNKQVINRIVITKPCKYKTKKNIGIGSSKKDVLNAYGDYVNHEWNDPNSILLGSIYGGIMIYLEKDMVREIYIGADSE